MNLYGYQLDNSEADHHPDFDDLALPFFHKGNEIGCICLHGIGGTPANVRVIADELSKRGFTVDAPMLAGHGTTLRQMNRSNWKKWIKTIEDSYDRLKQAGCKKVFVSGLSLGGILSAYLASETEERPCEGVVLISAPFKMKKWLIISMFMSVFFPYVTYPADKHTTPHSQSYRGLACRKLIDLERLIVKTRGKLKKIKCPVYAIWAKLDDKVDPHSSHILSSRLVSAPLKETTMENSPHGSTYGPEKEMVGTLVADFIESLI